MDARRRESLLFGLFIFLIVFASTGIMGKPDSSEPEPFNSFEPLETGSGTTAQQLPFPSVPGFAPQDAEEAETAAGSSVPFSAECVEGWIWRSIAECDLPQAAETILITYRDEGGSVLVRAGFLDFSGSVWSCTVMGDGWVETNIVQEMGEGRSRVYLIHMTEKEDADVAGMQMEWGRFG